jgi:CheY-like chemotaxis protein
MKDMKQQTYRALVVDDEPAIREATVRALTAKSFSCESAADGAEALACYRKSRHDLVITDLRMPGMHRYALALELLKEEEPPHIVVLAAVAEPGLARDLFSRGVDDVINKPVDMRVFATKMASLFSRQKWREASQPRQKDAVPISGHTIVARIEHVLEQASTSVSPAIEQLFEAAAEMVSDPPATMSGYLERLFAEVGDGERRESERASLLATVTVVPLNGSWEPCGEPFKAVARDVSEGGLSLLHTRAVTAEYLALRWSTLGASGQQINLILEVHRCQPMGPFYEVAGRFATSAA